MGHVEQLKRSVDEMKPVAFRRKFGKVAQLVGNIVEVSGLRASLGEICRILPDGGFSPIFAEVVGFQSKRLKLSPLTPLRGIGPGDLVEMYHSARHVEVSDGLLGRVLDGMGQPLDAHGPLPPGIPYPLTASIVNSLERPLIQEQLDVGIRCINGLLPVGKGQRMGIFAGSGVGKSTLLGMMARYTTADVNVIALIGERGREVNEFISQELGSEGLARSVLVVATSDQPATVRMRGAYLACAVAEYFRDQGGDVLFMMDSVTRFAMAAREVYLAAGEPPTNKGYTPGVFAQLPQLLERAGKFENASITGIYTVLVEGGDMDDPIADSVRSILDGHIVLDRKLTYRHHYPAVDILQSVSRLSNRLFTDAQKVAAGKFFTLLSRYRDVEDMISIGAYSPGVDRETDEAVRMIDPLNEYLRQNVEERCTVETAQGALSALFE